MMLREVPTEYASSARSSRAEIRRQSELFKTPQILSEFSNAVGDMILILNQNRQIVHANKYICSVFSISNEEPWLGLRPGEAMQCIHAFESEGGCGTTKFCRTCGSIRAVVTSQKGQIGIEECRISQEQNFGSLDLAIVATPIRVHDEEFTIYSARDITDEKRREALENIFFHDVLNTAGGVKGYLEILDGADEKTRAEFYGSARQLMENLIDEIVSQQELSAAEKGNLSSVRSILHANAFIKSLMQLYKNHEVAEAREIVLSDDSEDVVVTTDKRLLQRVVGNMIKNALEATEPGGTVTVACVAVQGAATFTVHNEKEIPEDIRLQLFQRSFSTKGKGRGLGTYSMRLLGEKYLGGTLEVKTSKDSGTIFSITIPTTPPAEG